MKNVFQLILILFSVIAYAEGYNLEGKIGKSTIYMQLNTSKSDNEVDVTYFYKSSLKNIHLEGTTSGQKFDLYFKDFNQEDKMVERFELVKSGKSTFKGFWTDSKGKKQPVTLGPIDFSKYPNPENIEFYNDIEAVKLKLVEFKQDSVSKYNGRELIWYSEKHCNAPFFRFGGNSPAKWQSVVNPILAKIHLQNALDQLNCSSHFSYSEGGGIEYTISINFLDDNLLGFQVFSSWFCGGAHPDFGGEGYLIDLNSGKNYELDEIIAFDKSVTTEAKSNFDLFSKYRDDFFAPGLFSLINATENFVKPAEIKEENEQEENGEEDPCDYTDLGVWDFPSWNFTKDGIEFTPIFPTVYRSCENSFLVPFDKLAKYKNKDFPYPLR